MEHKGSMKIIVLLVLLLVNSSLLSQAYIMRASAYTNVENSIWFLAPAVRGREGDLINISISISRGVGNVLVEAGGSVSESTKTSSKLAFYVACTAAGVDWSRYNAHIVFHTSSSVEGPSASLGIAIATYLLLKGYTRGLGVVITGAVSPDFTAIPIGGIHQKLEAAAEGGYQVFLPLANIGEVPSDYRNITTFITGLFNATRTMGYDPMINYSAEAIGTAYLHSIPSSYMNETLVDAYKMMEMAYNNITLLPSKFKEDENLLYKSTKAFIDQINETVNKPGIHPYSAASLAFTALVNASSLNEYYKLSRNSSYISGAFKRVRKEISVLQNEINSISGNTLWGFELKSIAASRLVEANETFLYLTNHYTNMSLRSTAKQLGYIDARLVSVHHWIREAELLNNHNPLIPLDRVKVALNKYISYVDTTILYQLSLIHESDLGDEVKKQLVESISRDQYLLSKARTYMERGELAFSYGLSMEAMASVLSRFSSIIDSSLSNGFYYMKGLEAYTRELAYTAVLLNIRASAFGYPSILASDYVEYGIQLMRMNNLETAQGITSYGVSSALFWMLVSQYGASQNQVTPLEQVGAYSTGKVIVYLLSAVFTGLALGYILSLYSVRREIMGGS